MIYSEVSGTISEILVSRDQIVEKETDLLIIECMKMLIPVTTKNRGKIIDIYVKENDIWERESENKQNLKQAIASVANKQFHKIKDWENNNPGWENSEKGTQKYIELIKEVTSGTDTDDDKSTNRIIKSIAKEVIIEK